MSRDDLYATITNKIIEQLEAGVLPWVRPWKRIRPIVTVSGVVGIPGMPYNASTGKSYSGINVLLLWLAGQAYEAEGWMTYKQAAALGANVRKGEKGTMVVFSDKFIPKDIKGTDAERAIFYLKSYVVFNVEQIENLPATIAPAPRVTAVVETPIEPEVAFARHEAADRLIANSGAGIKVGGDEAYYSPALDLIKVPEMAAYAPNTINWYRTVLHELSHWTGHDTRLSRNLNNRFGTPDYASEELVAEMGAAFTCAALGIEPTVRHADYIGSWLKVLRNDKKAIVKAASAASKAANLLLGFAEEGHLQQKEAA